MTSTMTTVVIHEPQEVLRRGLLEMLADVGPMRIIVATETESIAHLSEDSPATILIASSDSTTAEVDSLCRQFAAPSRLLIIVKSDSSETLSAVSRLPADGYLMLSDLDTEHLRTAIQCLVLGETVIPTKLAAHALKHSRGHDAGRWTLSTRELQVLRLLVEGLSNKEIARRISISPHGVKRHVGNILAKMNCPNRTQAVATALLAQVAI